MLVVSSLVLSGTAIAAPADPAPPPTIAHVPPRMTAAAKLAQYYGPNPQCYDRTTQPFTAVVDAHLHFEPFGGPSVPFPVMLSYLERSGVLFANMYGIGQQLPNDSPCEYYLDCPGTPVTPSIKHDFENAEDVLQYRPAEPMLTLAMSFPDLEHPEHVPEEIALLDGEFPGMFHWMGEVNLVKQALFDHDQPAVTADAIAKWAPFMATLRERNIPFAMHADLGDNQEPTKYLALIQQVVATYPDNKIVWLHLGGLSKELTKIPAEQHIAILKTMLDRYPNLYLDTAWRVIDDNYFQDPAERAAYVAFINHYSHRIMPGTDFVASHVKTYDIYANELEVTSHILAYVDDEAFRNIALGQSYFDILGLPYKAPLICKSSPQQHARN